MTSQVLHVYHHFLAHADLVGDVTLGGIKGTETTGSLPFILEAAMQLVGRVGW